MIRLLDLHALSCAGDTLVVIGLAGTIFFGVPAGEARGRVALYLLVTMVPFALLAPVVGPTLDRFRHGRRIALAATMLGRAALAWIIAENLFGFGLYAAAFGVLALSRAYGVARSAAVPRLLPKRMGLSQAGARASVYGTVAGAIVAPLGALAFAIGPQWPLRVASLIFIGGAMVSLVLPPKADSDPPEVPPRAFQAPWRHRTDSGDRILSGRLIVATLIGSACLRAVYGFLLLFLALAMREGSAPTNLLGFEVAEAPALGLIGGSLALGTFLATAIGTGLHISRPLWVQAVALTSVAALGLLAVLRFSLTAVLLLCLGAAIASGLAKLSVDASIQERVPEPVRASAFAHAETLLMLAWVFGGVIGLIPLAGRLGLAVVTAGLVAAAIRAVLTSARMPNERLVGRASTSAPATAPPRTAAPAAPPPAGAAGDEPPPGYHIFRPSAQDSGVGDPRIGA
jgi:MFS family permease